MIRKAKIADVVRVQKMLGDFAQQGKLLARSLSELYTNLRDMVVAEDDESREITGCCSLHIMWDNLAEIRSLAVESSYQGRGVGRQLVEACIVEARELGLSRLFALTYETGFFERMGFKVVDKSIFPQKIWADCLHCPKFPECDEVALVLDLEDSSKAAVGKRGATKHAKSPHRRKPEKAKSPKKVKVSPGF